MAIPLKLSRWHWAFVLLSVLWLARVVVLAIDDHPGIEAAATATFDDVSRSDLVLHDLPRASTQAEISAMYDRLRLDIDGETAAGGQPASVVRRSDIPVVDVAVHAQTYAWLDNELADIRQRGWRRAYVDFYTTWLAAWMIPVFVFGFFLWTVSRLSQRLRRSQALVRDNM